MGGNSDQTSTVTKPTRLPTAQSPEIVAARKRAQANTTDRTGRTSTVLSDALRQMIGSKGKLGA